MGFPRGLPAKSLIVEILVTWFVASFRRVAWSSFWAEGGLRGSIDDPVAGKRKTRFPARSSARALVVAWSATRRRLCFKKELGFG
ncbi:hypothetical protein AGR7A_pAt20316 [Agrobacterium deltaense NCPPB 1641]|uniref:Uncharacterized protein n=1 Tax=Agrobacterium deltaense NCPPB 1641 TaxID=1183425 RepID=A0A1S7UA24_9HYPH|nr:hypothetical protein AGR7A_pAt20316 [Agrobacterium deltaense NCPPB 1641]